MIHCIYRFTPKARKQFLKLPKSLRTRIKEKMKSCMTSENPFIFMNKLKGYDGLYKIRVGDYRLIIYPKDEEEFLVLLVTKVGHRRDVYLGNLW